MATVNVTSTPTTLDATGAAELAVTNMGSAPVFVNTQRVRTGQRIVVDTSRPVQVSTSIGQTSTVDVVVATPARAAGGGAGVSVLAYGARGDGAADDTAAIRAAIAALGASGGVVSFPAGRYRITGTLIMGSNVTMAGAGEQSSFIELAVANVHAVAGSDLSHVGLRDLHITGPGQGVGGTGDGIHFDLTGTAGNATFYVALSNVYVENFGRDAVSIQTPIVTDLTRVVAFRSGRHGIHLFSSGDADGTSCALSACFAAGSWGAGYRLKQMAYSSLNGCAADSNGIGYDYDTCVGINESGCGSEEPYNFDARNAGYNGKSRRVFNTKATFNAPYMIGNVGTSFWVTNSSVVTINGLFEGSPGNTDEPTNNPTTSLLVDAGCKVALGTASVVTPMSLAGGTTTDVTAPATGGGAAAAPLITGNEVTMDPLGSANTAMGGSGSVRLTYFTATQTGTYTRLRSLTATTAAGATPTLARMGVYTVAANGNLTLLAATANDTTLWATANTAYERTTTASYTLTAGQRYAFAHLVVTAAAVPSLVGKSSVGAGAANAELARAPRKTGSTPATDLSASFTFDLIGDTATAYYGACS